MGEFTQCVLLRGMSRAEAQRTAGFVTLPNSYYSWSVLLEVNYV